MTARSSSARVWSPSWPSPRMARPGSLSASPAISPRATMRSIWCASPPKRSAARAAADDPTWRRPAGPMAPRPRRRSRRSKKRWVAPDGGDRPLGKLVSVFTIVGGLTMIALPVAIISTAFADEVRRRDFVVTWGMLARVPLFSHLSATEIADIMRLLRARTIEAGEVLVRRGDPASSMYFITAGEVEIELPSQRVRLSDGTFFGEIALLHRTKRSGTVTATRKTKLHS